MKYRVRHSTTYRYGDSAFFSANTARLTPRGGTFQRCIQHRLVFDPRPQVVSERLDFFGNRMTFFSIEEPHAKLEVVVESDVEVLSRPVPRPSETLPWETVRDMVRSDLSPEGLEAFEFVFESPHVQFAPGLLEFAQASFPAGRPVLEGALDLMARVHGKFRYSPKATTIQTTLAELLESRAGVCQDFAHLTIGALRRIGIPARYMSGYLLTEPPPGQQRLVGADASHAWISFYTPGFGWIDMDPTNNMLPTDQHITLAWGRDYSDVCPLHGVVLGGGGQTMSVAVDVAPLD